MERVDNIKSIQIDVAMSGEVKLKIERNDNTVQVDTFELCDAERRDVLNEFLNMYQLHDKTVVKFCGEVL